MSEKWFDVIWNSVKLARGEPILGTAATLATQHPLEVSTRSGKRTQRYLRFVAFCAWLRWLRDSPLIYLPVREVATALSEPRRPKVQPNSVLLWRNRAVADGHLAEVKAGLWRSSGRGSRAAEYTLSGDLSRAVQQLAKTIGSG